MRLIFELFIESAVYYFRIAFPNILYRQVYNSLGFGRITHPCTVGTRLFRLINTQKMALRPPPPSDHRSFGTPLQGRSAKNSNLGEIREPVKRR